MMMMVVMTVMMEEIMEKSMMVVMMMSIFNNYYRRGGNYWDRDCSRVRGGISSRSIIRLWICSHVFSPMMMMEVFQMDFVDMNIPPNTQIVNVMRGDLMMEVCNVMSVDFNLKRELIRLHHLVKSLHQNGCDDSWFWGGNVLHGKWDYDVFLHIARHLLA